MALEEPGYQRAAGALAAGGLRVVPADMDEEGLRVDRLPSGIAGLGPFLGQRGEDVAAIAVALATVGMCAALLVDSASAPIIRSANGSSNILGLSRIWCAARWLAA